MPTTHRESRGGAKGPERSMEARSAGVPRGWGLGRSVVVPPQYGVWGHCPQKNLKFNSANLLIFKLQGLKYLKMSTHSTKVNCTLDKVNCTLCVSKHTTLGPAILSVNEWCDLENQVRGRSRSLKMALFDRLYATFYWSAIANIA